MSAVLFLLNVLSILIVPSQSKYADWSNWICNDNVNQTITNEVGVPLVNDKDYTIENFMVYEQGGYGIVNFGISQTLPVYSKWTTNNFNGEFHLIPINNIVKGIEVKEQGQYGIVDIRFIKMDNSFTSWATNNPNGNYLTINTSMEISQIQGMEQGGHGIVNLRIMT